MRVLIVSEGEHELGATGQYSALEILVRRLLDFTPDFERRRVSDPAVRVHIEPGRHDGYEKRALAWVRYAEREAFCALVFVVDQDNDRARQRQLDRVQDNTELALQRAFGVAIRTFDAWMLADEQALTDALECQIGRRRDPERIADPKQLCNELREASPVAHLAVAEFYARVANVVDLQLLETRCDKGFRPFASRVRALATNFCS